MCHTVNPLWTIILLQLSYRHKVTIVLLQAIILPESHYYTFKRYHIVTSHYHTVIRYHIVTVTVTLRHVTSLLSQYRYCKLSRTACGAKEPFGLLCALPESVILVIIAYRVLLIVAHTSWPFSTLHTTAYYALSA